MFIKKSRSYDTRTQTLLELFQAQLEVNFLRSSNGGKKATMIDAEQKKFCFLNFQITHYNEKEKSVRRQRAAKRVGPLHAKPWAQASPILPNFPRNPRKGCLIWTEPGAAAGAIWRRPHAAAPEASHASLGVFLYRCIDRTDGPAEPRGQHERGA